MKIWKMAGCLVLLAVIICGCVVLGQSAKVSAESAADEQQSTDVGEQTENTAPDTQELSTTVPKTYSTGLEFRSNGDGTCAVAGPGSCTAACILIPPESPAGDTVTEVLPYAFANSIVGAIELPATVSTLSAASFALCPRLAYIRVESESSSFLEYDGVLYTADGKTLVCCPAGRSAGELRLHEGLRRIAAGAFAECGKLTTVYFNGSTSEWHALVVGDGNEALYAATLRFHAQ